MITIYAPTHWTAIEFATHLATRWQYVWSFRASSSQSYVTALPDWGRRTTPTLA
jgi:hypothetical protein